MKALFYIKKNNKTEKVNEEELPSFVDVDTAQVSGIVSVSFSQNMKPTPRVVQFKRIITSLEDTVVFLYDMDTDFPVTTA